MVLLLFGVFVLALQDATVKLIAPETSFWQFQTLRAVGNALLIITLAMMSGGFSLLVPKNWRPVYLRGVMLSICMFCFFSGAPFLTIAQMAAGLYTYPLFVSLLAGPVLGETVGPWRIAALVIGAVGAGLILDPSSAEFSLIQLLPVAAGFFYACNIIILRRDCRHENPLSLTLAVAVLFFVTGLVGVILLSLMPPPQDIIAAMPFVAHGWPELTLAVLGFVLFCSLLNLSGNICVARAYQTADSSWLAPIDFSYLLFATIWGRVIFDVWPPQKSLLGMGLIVFAGMVTAWREQRRKIA
ncbi:MAG: DMT family transporter [Candidatus Puniceispirillum sp.]|nr:DMT family transporter [Candidatus Puniceispirillum sp.]MBL6774624.1 DMT family transporter [Candidatus Puniceispirillum sp.]